MKLPTRNLLTTVFAVAIFTTSMLWSQSPSARLDTTRLHISPVHQLRKGLDLWPLIANPGNTSEQRINETLTALNSRLANSLHECDANYRQWEQMVNEDSKGKHSTHGDWERKVKVTMAGSGYLSLVADETFIFCGGAHPDSETISLLFDLASGKLIDPLSFVAQPNDISVYSDTVADGSSISALVLPALKKMSQDTAVDECKNAFAENQSYLIWPDAKTGRLVALPFDLPHVVQACAERIELTTEQARTLGFKEELLRAIETEHRRVTPANAR
jgi:hypothetical protein